MAETTECTTCGAAVLAGATCGYCATVAPAGPPPPVGPEASGAGDQGLEGHLHEAVPANPPPAFEARRVRGLGVPVVAAAVVLGLGWPLTALAVSQVGRLPATTDLLPSSPEEGDVPGASGTPTLARGNGQVRLSGAVAYEGAVTPIGCTGGPPKLATFGVGAERFSILVNPPGVAPGGYPLGIASGTFVAVSKVAGKSQTWTSLGRAGAQGTITVGANGAVVAQFSGLEGSGGGAEGKIDGQVEMRCA